MSEYILKCIEPSPLTVKELVELVEPMVESVTLLHSTCLEVSDKGAVSEIYLLDVESDWDEGKVMKGSVANI